MKDILEKLNQIVEELIDVEATIMEASPDKSKEGEENTDDYTIKSSIPFEMTVDLLFSDNDKRAGRVALRKVMRGEEKNLTLRERGLLSASLISLLPVILQDRNVFNRIKRLKESS